MSKRKLLLADDSVTVQKVVNLAFESEDIEVITADNGNSAFEKFVEFSPDLVMADINLPGANGYEICERIRQDEETKHIPVVLLVGSFVPFSEEKAERVGANGFLKKPFQSIGLLVNKVTDLLGMNGDDENDSSEGGFSEADTQPMPAYKLPERSDSEVNYSTGEEFGDDELIETERVGDYSLMDETSKYETSTEFDAVAEETGKTQPMIYTEVEELGLNSPNEETSAETVYELADEPDDFQSAPTYDFDQESKMTEENSIVPSDSYDEYSAFRQSEEKEDFPAPQEISALDLDEFELLELPPLDKLPETPSTAFDETPDNSEFEAAREETIQSADDDFADYAETTAEESSSLSESEPTEETAVNLDGLTDQTETETTESKETETVESYYSPESETDAAKEFSSVDEEKAEEEIPASYPEETAEHTIETESIIAEETNQEISRASENELVVHYFPPEVIDQIAERVVEKLAEKLGK